MFCTHVHLALVVSRKLAISQHQVNLIHEHSFLRNQAEHDIAVVNAFVGAAM